MIRNKFFFSGLCLVTVISAIMSVSPTYAKTFKTSVKYRSSKKLPQVRVAKTYISDAFAQKIELANKRSRKIASLTAQQNPKLRYWKVDTAAATKIKLP